MSTSDDPRQPEDALRQIVEMARQALRERGYTDEQIEALLNRKTAPEYDN